MAAISYLKFDATDGGSRLGPFSVTIDLPQYLPVNPEEDEGHLIALSHAPLPVQIGVIPPKDIQLVISANDNDILFAFRTAAGQEIVTKPASITVLRNAIDALDNSLIDMYAINPDPSGYLDPAQRREVTRLAEITARNVRKIGAHFLPEVELSADVYEHLFELMANRLGTVRRGQLQYI